MSPKKEIGKITYVNVRDLWKSEARDFTPWLAEEANLQTLSEALGGINLVDAEVEVNVGGYSCDIKCKVEGDDRIVIIENQLEQSNHDHLGKSIVYASGLGASIIIWIVKEAREEHASAIEWLNLHSDASVHYFLVEIQAIKIGDSEPAPLFKVIQQPNDYVNAIKASDNKELTRSQIGRYDFWTDLNDYIEKNNYKLEKHKPSYDHWTNYTIGSKNCHMQINLLDQEGKIRFLIWIPDNKDVYDRFYEHKQEIESELPFKLEWDRKDGKKASSISTYIEGFSFDNKKNHHEIFKQVCELIIAFRTTFKKYIR